jgi:hypothetical protein
VQQPIVKHEDICAELTKLYYAQPVDSGIPWVNDESIEDTLLNLANYAIGEILKRRNEKLIMETPKVEEAKKDVQAEEPFDVTQIKPQDIYNMLASFIDMDCSDCSDCSCCKLHSIEFDTGNDLCDILGYVYHELDEDDIEDLKINTMDKVIEVIKDYGKTDCRGINCSECPLEQEIKMDEYKVTLCDLMSQMQHKMRK